MNVTDLNPDMILVVGDWHGYTHQALEALDFAASRGIKVVVQVGDFGIWDNDSSFLNKLEERLEKDNMQLLFVDGNHENFNQLYEYGHREDGSREVRERITHLPRGFRWEWCGARFAALGGAHSVDKDMRRPGTSWWEQEWVSDYELQKFRDGGPADVVFMHDSPAGAPNTVTDTPLLQISAARYFGQHNLDLAAEHRRRLATAVDPTDPALIFHGHYHQQMEGVYTRPEGRSCRVLGLDEGGGGVLRSTVILDVLSAAPALIETRRAEQA